MEDSDKRYEIHEVAELTGLSTARLRAWERRYEVVRPERQANGYRAYSATQVALLSAFAALIKSGARIGHLAASPRDAVMALANGAGRDDSPIARIVDAVRHYDRERLTHLVATQLRTLGVRRFAEEIVVPLAPRVGDLWALNKLPIAAEHLASEVVLESLKRSLQEAVGDGPLLLATTLSGERHEWGILATLAVAQSDGWQCRYFGPDLPLDEIVKASWTLRPAALAISVNDSALVDAAFPELRVVVSRLPPQVRAVIGGRGAAAHARRLERCGFARELGPPPPADSSV